ncbi:MAG: homocysteine S-methyltransferase family protein [Fimbriimonadaceae bacterium]|nr:homocysteine S-methyltransferase family protein [Fimbriimonadaceae bacterium]
MTWLDEGLAHGPLLGDGAMGTMLLRAGLKPGTSSELWNVERPDAVEAVHRAYVDAGARIITTNTFGGSPIALGRHGLGDRAAELNAAAVSLARRASDGKARVIGDVGPFGGFLEPYGDTTIEELETTLRTQIGALRDAGADGIVVETMVDPVELATAVRVAREHGEWPVFATFAFQRHVDGFRTLMGTTVEQAISAALMAGADAVGANCGTDLGLDDYLRLADALVGCADGRPVIVQPNAGTPHEADGRIVYLATPMDLADWALRAISAGVRILGGCCGTTPDHLRAMARILDALA